MNLGLTIAKDIAGTAHYGGPARQNATTGQYYVVNSQWHYGRQRWLPMEPAVCKERRIPVESGLSVESGLPVEPGLSVESGLSVEPRLSVESEHDGSGFLGDESRSPGTSNSRAMELLGNSGAIRFHALWDGVAVVITTAIATSQGK